MADTTHERFWSKVALGVDGCWLWVGATMSNGYGRFGIGGTKIVLAHRWSYESMVSEIPPGLVIDHLCRNRACVNPWHLEPVPQKVNVLRGRGPELLRARRSGATHCSRGHEFTPGNTYTDKRGQRSCKSCARVADRDRKRVVRALAKVAAHG
jgi:HNH endonuclease